MSTDGLTCVKNKNVINKIILGTTIPLAIILLISLVTIIIICVKKQRKYANRTVNTANAASISTPITFTYDEMFEQSTVNNKIVYWEFFSEKFKICNVLNSL